MYFFGFGAGENERETYHGRIAVQGHSGLSPLKGEMSRSDRGVPLRAATPPTSPFWGGFAKGTCSNLSPLKGEMSRSDRGVDPSEQLRCPPPLSGEALQEGRVLTCRP